jgi:hypothetical protein
LRKGLAWPALDANIPSIIMKFSGIERQKLTGLISIVVSLKNKYGIVPLAVAARGYPVPNTMTVC